MTCLVALELGDTQAKVVRLFGPQITPESLRHWQQLLDRKKIDRVQMFVNEGDPVPAMSYLASLLIDWTVLALSPSHSPLSPYPLSEVLANKAYFKGALNKDIAEHAASIEVKMLPCKSRRYFFDLACHEMMLYQENTATQ
jgi:hypothetical protein